MPHLFHFILFTALSTAALVGATASADAAFCKTIYGIAVHSNPDVATGMARSKAEATAQRNGRGGIIHRGANRRLIRRSPPLWRVYYRVRFCAVQQHAPRHRVRGPITPRRFR